MKFVRNLSMLVLLVCTSLSFGCAPAETPATTGGGGGAAGMEAGSGVAGGADMPGTPVTEPAADAPAADAPAADAPKADAPANP